MPSPYSSTPWSNISSRLTSAAAPTTTRSTSTAPRSFSVQPSFSFTQAKTPTSYAKRSSSLPATRIDKAASDKRLMDVSPPDATAVQRNASNIPTPVVRLPKIDKAASDSKLFDVLGQRGSNIVNRLNDSIAKYGSGARSSAVGSGGGGGAAQPSNWDFASPGVAEQFFQQNEDFWTGPSAMTNWWENNQDYFGQQGAGEQYVQSILGTQPEQLQNRTAGSYENFLRDQGILKQIFQSPGAMEDYWATVKGTAAPEISQNTQSAYDQFVAGKPSIAEDPGLDPYFENAKRRAQEEIAQTMAARGMFGSSASGDMATEALTDLNAEQARLEADYNLRRLAEGRAWEELGLSGARSADDASQARAQYDLDRIMGFGDLAESTQTQALNRATEGRLSGMAAADIARSADTSDLARAQYEMAHRFGLGELGLDADRQGLARTLGGGEMARSTASADLAYRNAGMAAAVDAQNARRMRGRDYIGDVMGPAAILSQMVQQQQNMATQTDRDLLDAIMGYTTGTGAEALNSQRYQEEVARMEAALGRELAAEEKSQLWAKILGGATVGGSVGGPWGAVAGAGVGLASELFS